MEIAIWTVGIMLVVQFIPSTILEVEAIFCAWMASKGKDEFIIKKFSKEYQKYMGEVSRLIAFRGLKRLLVRRRST